MNDTAEVYMIMRKRNDGKKVADVHKCDGHIYTDERMAAKALECMTTREFFEVKKMLVVHP